MNKTKTIRCPECFRFRQVKSTSVLIGFNRLCKDCRKNSVRLSNIKIIKLLRADAEGNRVLNRVIYEAWKKSRANAKA
jgi:hypothetical protein